MKKSTFTVTGAVILFLYLGIFVSCQNDVTSEPSNPFVGTWKHFGAVDTTGNEIEFFKDELGYITFLEDGTFISLGFRKNFPQTGMKPSTLEEYEEIFNNSWGRIGTYKFDFENKKEHLKYTYDLNPQSIGREITLNFKAVGDTASLWFDGGNTIFKAIKVK